MSFLEVVGFHVILVYILLYVLGSGIVPLFFRLHIDLDCFASSGLKARQMVCLPSFLLISPSGLIVSELYVYSRSEQHLRYMNMYSAHFTGIFR